MRLSKIYIENFRNFKKLELYLSEQLVIVGENKVGKSNLIHALRFLLDPTLPDSARQLDKDDFWDGLEGHIENSEKIIISIELTDFDENDFQLAILCTSLISGDPMIAKLTYEFRPKQDLDRAPKSVEDYEFVIYGGKNETNKVIYDLRKYTPLEYLPALRDSESDLTNWRRSPLKPLLDKTVNNIDPLRLKSVADEITKANQGITQIEQISNLESNIRQRLSQLAKNHSVETSLNIAPTEANRLIRSIRLMIDNVERSIGEASLGTSNLLYLTLRYLYLEQLIEEKVRHHTFLAIEEPEAHLHPHVQRLVYRDRLKVRNHQSPDLLSSTTITNILTTHSPHIASVTPLKSIVLLRQYKDNGKLCSSGVSTANIKLSDKEIMDLERYLEVTRAEMLFARGIILVEGDAEQYLIPALAKSLSYEYDFDANGISVCSVSGTNFLPYVKLLSELAIPFTILTDKDPQRGKVALALNRVSKLLNFLEPQFDTILSSESKIYKQAELNGIFTNKHTLEVDLVKAGNHSIMAQVLKQETINSSIKQRALKWQADEKSMTTTQLLKDIEKVGKGRYSQSLSNNYEQLACPLYIKKAIVYIINKLHSTI